MTELFLTILNLSITAGYFILAVLVLRLVLKKAPKWIIMALWGLVALRLLCPFTLESPFSVIPSGDPISPEIITQTVPGETPAPNPQPMVPAPSTGSVAPAPGVQPPAVEVPDLPVTPEAPGTAESKNPLHAILSVCAVIWLAGIGAMLLYSSVSYWRLRRKVAAAVRLRDNIFQTEQISTPFVLGILRPRIYLPFCLDGADMEYVIAHEEAHIRRKDHWWKPLGFTLLAVYWFNPLIWVAYILLCRDIELACDEKVVKALGAPQRADYSQALLSCSVGRKSIAACPLAFGEVGVKTRVKSILNYKKPAF